MAEWEYESSHGRSSHPNCGEYIPEDVVDYVTADGEVRSRTTWHCPIHGDVVEDELYPAGDKDDETFVWGAFLAAKNAGAVPPHITRPKNLG